MNKASLNKLIKLEDVCVLLIGFKRPELLRKKVQELQSTIVPNVYISIDGGPDSHTPEMEEFKSFAREKLNCQTTYLVHHMNNLGLVKHITDTISEIFSIFDYLIVIEDDVVLSENFITNMINGLNLQSRLNQNGVVSGGSTVYYQKLRNKWRETTTPGMWGWACSATTWDGIRFNLSDVNLKNELKKSSTWQSLTKTEKEYWIAQFIKVQKNPVYTWEYQFLFHLFKNDMKNIAPIFSMTGNEGLNRTDAFHTSDSRSKSIDRNNKNINNSLVLSLSRFSKFYNLFKVETWVYQKVIKEIAEISKPFREKLRALCD